MFMIIMLIYFALFVDYICWYEFYAATRYDAYFAVKCHSRWRDIAFIAMNASVCVCMCVAVSKCIYLASLALHKFNGLRVVR